MKPDMTAEEHLQQCAACNHGRTPCLEYQRVWPVAEPASTGEPPECKEFVAHLIAGASWFICALPKGHKEEGHRAAGKCFKHGFYLGEASSVPQCPQWPDCAKAARPSEPSTPARSTLSSGSVYDPLDPPRHYDQEEENRKIDIEARKENLFAAPQPVSGQLGCRKCDVGIEHMACDLYDKLAGDAQKVEEIARQIVRKFADKYGNVGVSHQDIDMVSELLRPYFPPASQTPTEIEMSFRRYMWLNHGHDGLYGDDGQMQCARCPLDFKRAPLGTIYRKLAHLQMEKLATPASTARTDGWEKALRELADCGDCDCDHDDENCCAKLHIPCAQCTAAVALAEAGITDYIGDFAAPGSVPQAEPPKGGAKEIEFTGSWLDVAICIAVKSHAGQLDKSRKPYILHPLRVMDSVAQEGEAAMIAAVLHDAVEDTELSLESIKEQFGDEVAGMVDSLSRRKGKETYREFIQRVKLNPVAAKIKIADLRDNLSRIENLARNEQSIRHRYEKALIELGAAQPGDDKPEGRE